jgi:hypothetical protein
MDPISKSQNEPRVIGRPWPKGVSGNPAGRPPGKKPLTQIYEEILEDPNTRDAVKQQIISTMTSKGMAGVLERREAAERIEGKIAQTVDMNVTGHVTLEAVLEARDRAGRPQLMEAKSA